jgi:hypothetical protein
MLKRLWLGFLNQSVAQDTMERSSNQAFSQEYLEISN